ncbi:MAG: hypothetical protein Q9222_006879 [Ikaeria aurantiellina]
MIVQPPLDRGDPWTRLEKDAHIIVHELYQSKSESGKDDILNGELDPVSPVATPTAPTICIIPPAGSDDEVHTVPTPAKGQERKNWSRCPVAKEFQQIREHHSTLVSTGCTKDFCQAGRAVHTDEPRIGENRAAESVEAEAESFLQEFFSEQPDLAKQSITDRINEVLQEIRSDARQGMIRESKRSRLVGGNWQQTPAELEFGIRRAWRNARKCIMRSHSDELNWWLQAMNMKPRLHEITLAIYSDTEVVWTTERRLKLVIEPRAMEADAFLNRLCDLQDVTSSANMASKLIKKMREAFNGGNVLPTGERIYRRRS